MSLRFATSVALLSLAACALGPGEPFGEVEGTLSGSLESRGRLGDDGWLSVVGSWEVRLDAVEVEVGEARLVDRFGAGGGGSFDPTRPPPGWLCHGDHCHTPEGDLVSYEEAAVLVGGGPSGPRVLVTLDVGAPLGIVGAGAGQIVLDECRPSCWVGRGAADVIEIEVQRLRIEGAARDRQPDDRLGGEVPLTIDLVVSATVRSAPPAAILFDRGEPPVAAISLELLVHPSLLDGAHFDELLEDGRIFVLEDEPAGHSTTLRELLVQNLESSRISIEAERFER